MKSTVVDESLSSFKPMYCSREYQASTRLIQQYEKSTLNNERYSRKTTEFILENRYIGGETDWKQYPPALMCGRKIKFKFKKIWKFYFFILKFM